MATDRPVDTFVLRVRREQRDHSASPSLERWQIEHVQTGLKVYVRDLEEAVHRDPDAMGTSHLGSGNIFENNGIDETPEDY